MDQPTFSSVDDPDLARLAASATSLADLIRAFGMPLSSSSYRTLHRRLAQAEISVTHFKHAARAERRPAPSGGVLRIRKSSEGREGAARLRAAMRANGVAYLCEACGLGQVWQGYELVLEVDHVDGDPLNCRLENLRFLCPNCHQQTPTYGRRRRPPRRALGIITENTAREIREAWGPYVKGRRGRVSARALASQYGVSLSSINHIVQGRSWRRAT